MSKYNCIGTVGRMWQKNLPDYWNDSYVDLINFSQRYLCKPNDYIKYIKASVSWHSGARNQLVEDSLGEWLLMLDTDHTFAPDLLERLLYFKTKHNCRVISGIYQYKYPPHSPVLNMWDDQGHCAPVLEFPKDVDVFQVGTVPGGCLLVDRSVYREIIEKFNCGPFDIVGGLSEDYSFCWRCKELNIPIFVSPKIECHHVIETVLSIQDYKCPKEYVDDYLNCKVENGKLIL